MGSAYSWLAMKDVSADEACEALGLVRCGGEFDFPETVFSGAALPNGWYVVVVGSEAFDFFMDFSLEDLSESRDLIVIEVEEHVMYFNLAYWRGGVRLWSVVHDGQEGVYHLEAEGDLPVDFETLKAKYIEQQNNVGGENAGVDCLSEVPVELARGITGFGYNLSYDDDEEEPVFEELDVSHDVVDETSGFEEPNDREEPETQPPEPDPGESPPPPSRLELWLLKWFDRGRRGI